MSDTTITYSGLPCRLSDTDDGQVLAVEVNGMRMPVSAWNLAKRLAAAGVDGIATGDVSHTDRQILESAGYAPRTDSIGARVWLNSLPTATKFVVRVPPEAPKRAKQHYSGGAPVGGPTGPGFDRYRA